MDIRGQFLILVPIIVGLVQVVKAIGVSDRYAPLSAIMLGVAGAFLIGGVAVNQEVLQGIIAGLSAAGLYSGVKTTAGL